MPATAYPAFVLPSKTEVEGHVARGRALRSRAAIAMFAGIARPLARGFEATLGRAILGIRHRDTTRWPAPGLGHGRI